MTESAGAAASRQQVVSEVAKRHNADSTWQDDPALHWAYTVDIQRRLVNADGRPIVIVASIDDIWATSAGEYVLQADVDELSIHFALRCAPDALTAALNRQSRFVDQFAIVAQIATVRKPLLGLTAETSANQDAAADVELQAPADVIATGRCIDVVLLPSGIH